MSILGESVPFADWYDDKVRISHEKALKEVYKQAEEIYNNTRDLAGYTEYKCFFSIDSPLDKDNTKTVTFLAQQMEDSYIFGFPVVLGNTKFIGEKIVQEVIPGVYYRVYEEDPQKRFIRFEVTGYHELTFPQGKMPEFTLNNKVINFRDLPDTLVKDMTYGAVNSEDATRKIREIAEKYGPGQKIVVANLTKETHVGTTPYEKFTDLRDVIRGIPEAREIDSEIKTA